LSPFGPEEFVRETGVSRETLIRLQTFATLLAKWQKAINLVSPATLPDLWSRHFLDSAQLLPLAPAGAQTWLDIGSGAGFPGLVLAILGAPQVHLVESDQRKSAFQREVARATGTNATFHVKRIEDLRPEDVGVLADVITARALAPPEKVLAWTAHLRGPHTTYLLPTGRSGGGALTGLPESPNISSEELPSRSDSDSRILRIRGFSRD
jgi:16S rRNA (guanine527-N7)-methyltransferase